MSEYTPTTKEVRAFYVAGIPPHRASVSAGNAEFDRWLQSVKSEAKAEGWDEGQIAGRNNEHHTNWSQPISNPYRSHE